MPDPFPLDLSFPSPNLAVYGLPALAAYVLSVIGTWVSIAIARRVNALDRPGRRSSHAIPTPRIGGVGVALGVFGVFAACAVLWPVTTVFKIRSDPGFAFALLAGGGVALGFGLFDDLRGLPARIKLLCQLACAVAATWCGVTIRSVAIPGFAEIPLGAAAAPLTVAWILFFMNAFNFMDGMDGQTGAFGGLAAAGLIFALFADPQPDYGAPLRIGTLCLTAAALVGFMRFNVCRPAKTFMGDGGSQMTGFILSLALAASGPAFVIPGLMALWPFVYDVSFTLVRRARRRENLFEAHREHLYQRLMKTGLTHRQTLFRGVLFHLACLAGSFYLSLLAARPEAFANPRHGVLGSVAFVALATLAYTASVWSRERRTPENDGQ